MGYEEHRAPGRRGQHVAEQSAAGSGIEMGRGFIEYQQIRIGEQSPGYGQPLALAAGQRGPVGADRGVPAQRQRLDPVQQPDPGRGLGQLLVGGPRPGQAKVVA